MPQVIHDSPAADTPEFETYHGKGNPELHGFDGPIHVSDGTFRNTKVEDDVLQAAAAVGWPEIKDLQDLDSNNGFERWLRYISPDGKRQDTARKYLHDKLEGNKYSNLHILVESKVVRVLLDDQKRAIGVEYTPNPSFQLQLAATQHPKRTVKARKLVVVSCGACGTPSVLERSGVGDPKILKRAGIPVLVDLPGVGYEYEDHNIILYPYRTGLESHETADWIFRDSEQRQALVDSNHPQIGWNTVELSSKLRPTEAQVDELGPEFRAAWNKDFKHVPNRPLMLTAVISAYVD